MIHLILGRQGSGKSLFLVKKAYEFHKKGFTIYSNIHLNFPYKPLDYMDVIECKLTNAMVILDEIHLLLSSRRSMSKKSILIVDSFLSQVRKKGLEVYGTTQSLRKVDVRFREEADFTYFCTKWCFINGVWQEVTHNYSMDKNIPLMISLQVFESFSGDDITFSFLGNDYFNFYDSSQIININELELNAYIKEMDKK